MTTALAEPLTTQTSQTGAPASGSESSAHPSQVVSFRLAKEEYGLDIMRVQEIILMGDITSIPEVPDYIHGLINLRGKVIPIVDLRKRFGLATTPNTEQTRIIVVNAADSTFGIIVDAVSQVLRFEGAQMEPPPTGLAGMEQAYIQGLVKMEEKIMILLNMDAVLSREAQARVAGAVEAET
jgi:purine-binding chemotaxis protein CheW